MATDVVTVYLTLCEECNHITIADGTTRVERGYLCTNCFDRHAKESLMLASMQVALEDLKNALRRANGEM